jgi:CelD/BcsL family acetyltransferase involved in cellulose biosynthesis
LERDFETFLRLEASGWKGRAGTAIISRRGTDRLYRNAARGFADAGWLRLQLLEVDGTAIAGDLSCSFAEAFHMIKTAFDERHAAASPGLLMRAESLRSAVEEGARRYEFLGAPDPYKMRWGAQLRERAALGAYRGAWRALPVYRRNVRPVLKTVRDSARDWAKRVAPGRRD